ncbi:hypothetical protein [Fimbriimonas ginsengisoli]|uniref:DUF455 family protein n=1 Tax=Fimbriimonas ginsengisoli Gsoil 348 TaxID=661478 RepID=A0A068NUL9_FIMGI|nr:hypothetical protein [Fimbriimonas ginsengisoli]AIE86465.1 hypothetical protein OP10G_3097 [Fimbriimonas ginsengisoli Gsoil 348]
MSATPSNGIPPLAGLATYEQAMVAGLGVDENVDLMRRYNFIESRLYQMSAAFMNPTPEWEVKGALSLHLYLDGEHSQLLRQRVAELRRPPLYLDKSPDSKLELFLEEALRAENTLERLVGIFRVIRPTLLDAYRTHLAAINPIFDFPTARLLKLIIAEEEQMIEWGTQAVAAVISGDEERKSADRWEAHLRAYLAAAGGIDGKGEIPSDLSLPEPRSVKPFVPDVDPKRDWRSGDIYNFHYRANDVYLDSEADWDERVLALMYKRFHEMDVPEMMASIVLQTQGKPWEYYRDMGRQLWDEARHSMMGEVWFARYKVDWSKYPNHVGWSMHLNLDRSPLERHIILYFIEQNLMDGKTGKRLEWKIAQSAADPLATYFQDYDWADEVLHAQIGRRWLKPDVGDVKELLEKGREIAGRASPTLEAKIKSTPQVDWWPDYVRDALGKESTSRAGTDNALVPTFE